ncbi:MAG: coproporphyrinogen III oxidase [Corynebacteriales bacterium]|nr:coproporphyrinogen III oxidase [Mycobacteriales bacterium]
MSPALPSRDPAPPDGALSQLALASLTQRDFGVYLHVPFCAARCGYCDFNTYTPSELGGLDIDSYLKSMVREIACASRVLAGQAPAVRTVFVGGGTPTMLGSDQLAQLVAAVEKEFGFADDVEITTEANPESVDETSLRQLRAAGFNRISLGMQSARASVLAMLERKHRPGRALAAVAEARNAGFEHINLDLIYGAAAETEDDWLASLDAVTGAGVDHVSAYALIVEDGTALARKVARGQVAAPDDDVLADRYLLAEDKLTGAGMQWYEVSNWAMSDAARCRHNELYWRGQNWWGFGPGAHSHVGGVRWWNVKHPRRYSALLADGSSPAAGRETLSEIDQRLEEIMLGMRMRQGLPLSRVGSAAPQLMADGLLDPTAFAEGRAALTLRGRLLADSVIRDLS